jgi:Ni,Fe-hydrogenase III large subunit
MTNFADILSPSSQRWPRVVVTAAQWEEAGEKIGAGKWTLVAHWAEPGAVHVALRERGSGKTGILSLSAKTGKFPSLGRHCFPARRLERAIFDLYGIVPEGAPDTRPWLDHGNWGIRHPLGIPQPPVTIAPYQFLPVEGESLHQMPVGPVHAGIIEPGHFRFTCQGETVVRLEARLGYAHKGIEGLLVNAPLARAAQLAGRVSGDSTVAYASAFALAVENACGIDVPPRAAHLRAIMLELERIANHIGDIGGVCNDAAFTMMLAHCGILRERVLRVCNNVFGHRLMMDSVVPGGVVRDIEKAELKEIATLVEYLARKFPDIVALYDETASLQDRMVRTGMVAHDLVAGFGAGGPVGRASGRTFDTRKILPVAPYDTLDFEVPLLERGDVDARVRIRILEVEQSLSLLRQLTAGLPRGETRVDIPAQAGEGAAMVEGFRGDIFVFVRLADDGTIARCHLRDPSWFHWPLLEVAIDGNIVADFPLINKSFNSSYAGHDL